MLNLFVKIRFIPLYKQAFLNLKLEACARSIQNRETRRVTEFFTLRRIFKVFMYMRFLICNQMFPNPRGQVSFSFPYIAGITSSANEFVDHKSLMGEIKFVLTRKRIFDFSCGIFAIILNYITDFCLVMVEYLPI